jgi:hypothetical protein
MNNDSLNTRVFKIKKKNTDPSVNDNIVELKLTNSAPIVTTSNKTEQATFIESASFTTNSDIEPYDPDMDNRFKLIATFKSYYRDVLMSLYYDYKYNDMFVVENFDTIDVDIVVSDVINVLGYKVGFNKVTRDAGNVLTNIVDDTKLPEAKDQKSVSMVVLNLSGITNSYDVRVRYGSNGVTIYKKINAVAFLKIKRTDLFDDVPIPNHYLKPETLTKYMVRYNGFKKPEYVYIPVPL